MDVSANQEGKLIKETLLQRMPRNWDGKESILELKIADYQWRQMEWIGWYFEYKAKEILKELIGGKNGVLVGRTSIDYQNEFIWDLKTHVSTNDDWAILNDREAIETCISEHGGIGFIVAVGATEYDENNRFKDWHDLLKGGRSDYEKDRISRGAPSRRRKISFLVKTYKIFFFDKIDILQKGHDEGWLGGFQTGMRNSDGSPRRRKVKIHMEKIPKTILIE